MAVAPQPKHIALGRWQPCPLAFLLPHCSKSVIFACRGNFSLIEERDSTMSGYYDRDYDEGGYDDEGDGGYDDEYAHGYGGQDYEDEYYADQQPYVHKDIEDRFYQDCEQYDRSEHSDVRQAHISRMIGDLDRYACLFTLRGSHSVVSRF